MVENLEEIIVPKFPIMSFIMGRSMIRGNIETKTILMDSNAKPPKELIKEVSSNILRLSLIIVLGTFE